MCIKQKESGEEKQEEILYLPYTKMKEKVEAKKKKIPENI